MCWSINLKVFHEIRCWLYSLQWQPQLLSSQPSHFIEHSLLRNKSFTRIALSHLDRRDEAGDIANGLDARWKVLREMFANARKRPQSDGERRHR